MKKIVAAVLCFVLSLGLVFVPNQGVYAQGNDEGECVILSDNKRVPLYTNYENPETGEYIRWEFTKDKAGEVVKKFSFKIQWSVTSSNFTVKSSKVKVSANAHIEDYNGTVFNCNDGHRYEVQIIGVYARSLYFAIGGTESGTIDGLKKGGSYKVKIINTDSISDANYLVGSGTIKSM